MSTQPETGRPAGAPPPWLLPALVGTLLVLAAVLAFAITSRSAAPAQIPATQVPLDQPAAQAPAVQAADGESTGVEDPAAGHGTLNPDGPRVEVIGLADARARFDAGSAIFVDVRSGGEYAAGHIPGALTITSQELESRIKNVPAGTVIIAYGDADRPDSSQRGAQIFMELGYPTVIALDGGFQTWRDAGHPVEP
jgi:rhodanese-related sulfurtransferase